MSDPTFTITEDFFNVIELHHAPSRWEGRREISRGRTIERRRDGTVVRDETYDIGVVIEWPEPEPPTLLQRVLRWFA